MRAAVNPAATTRRARSSKSSAGRPSDGISPPGDPRRRPALRRRSRASQTGALRPWRVRSRLRWRERSQARSAKRDAHASHACGCAGKQMDRTDSIAADLGRRQFGGRRPHVRPSNYATLCCDNFVRILFFYLPAFSAIFGGVDGYLGAVRISAPGPSQGAPPACYTKVAFFV